MKQWLRASALGLVLTAVPAFAGAAPLSNGIRSSGTMVVQATYQGTPITAGGNIALYRRDNRYRLDVLSFQFPGTDAALSATFGALLPQGGATLIYDGSTGGITVYSNANRSYYAEAPKSAPPNAPAPAAAGTSSSGSDPLAALASLTRQLQTVQNASILFTGHSTLNGHPVSNLDVLLKRQLPGKPLEDYHATLALGDDLNGFPVRILFSSTPPSKDAFGGSMRIDLTSVQNETPDESMFAVPSGYTRVNSMADVIKPHELGR